MQLKDREPVPATEDPIIYIGHRFQQDAKSGKIKVSKKWHAAYSHQGQRLHEPLKTTNKMAAQRAAHVIHQRLQRGEERHVQRRVGWQEMFDPYIAFLRSKGRAGKTIEKYKVVLTDFIDFAKRRKRLHPDTVNAQDFWAFNELMMQQRKCKPRAGMPKTGLHGKTRGDRLTIIKQWFKFATVKTKPPMLAVNPIVGEEIEEAESSPQPCFTPEQVSVLLENACKDHERVIFAVFSYLGLRFGEVRDLEWSDFDFKQGDHGWVTIQRGGSSGRTKGKTNRRIPVNPSLRQILDEVPGPREGRMFSQRPSKKYPNGGRPLNGDKLLKSLKRLCKRCKFPNPEQYKIHTFRHAFASMLARNNVAYKQALGWMGHKDSDILNLYIKLFDPDAEKAMKTLVYSPSNTAV